MSKLDKIRTDNNNNDDEVSTKYKVSFYITAGIAFLSLLVLILTRFVYHPVIVNGSSMYPTLKSGQIISSYKSFSPEDIQYNSIIVFHAPDAKEYYIKRVVGLPGDTIYINRDGLHVNGELIQDDFPHMEYYQADSVVLGKDEYYVLGDNRNNSHDSRDFGPIKYSSITNIARVKEKE